MSLLTCACVSLVSWCHCCSSALGARHSLHIHAAKLNLLNRSFALAVEEDLLDSHISEARIESIGILLLFPSLSCPFPPSIRPYPSRHWFALTMGSINYNDSDVLDVLIVGAGISGINAAYRLKDELPDKKYLIFEGRDNLGGTWDLFKYPGIRSDSDLDRKSVV